MADLTLAGLTILAFGGMTFMVGFPLAMRDNPSRRDRD